MWRSLLCCGLFLSLTTLSFGADEEKKPEKGRRGGGPGREEFMKKMDKDGDGKLSDEEKAEGKKAMEARHEEMKAKMLEKYDKDSDGKLSDDEKSAMRKDFGGAKGKGRGPGGPGGPGGFGGPGGNRGRRGGEGKKDTEKKEEAKE